MVLSEPIAINSAPPASPVRKPNSRRTRRFLWWIGLSLFALCYVVVTDYGGFLLTTPILLEPGFLSQPILLHESFWQSGLSVLFFLAGLVCWLVCFVLWTRQWLESRPLSAWGWITSIVTPLAALVVIAGTGFIALFGLIDLASVFQREVLVVPAFSVSDEAIPNNVSPFGCRTILGTEFIMMGPWVTNVYLQNPGSARLSFLTSFAIEDDQVPAVANSSVRWEDAYPDGDTGTLQITGPNETVTVVCPLAP